LYKKGIFDSKIKNIDNYVFIAMKRKAINVLKSEKRQQYASLNQRNDNSETEYLNLLFYNDESHQNIELFENIIAYMSQNLNDEEQNLINLYYFMNMTFDEIGKCYKVSRETIRRRINKAVAKIRRWYK
jgi:RNA polymerase sigma factor (sigma-70 family)